jgi:fermentation-respiration switch protein FrsA (DUF1100 family)
MGGRATTYSSCRWLTDRRTTGGRPRSVCHDPAVTRGRPLVFLLTLALALASAGSPASPSSAAGSLPITTKVLHLLDTSRVARPLHGRPASRRLTTILRYPAAPARGPFPLIVFAHGFAVTPATYYRLLRAWAEAGFVVAAPVFPLENAAAPGGPNESDLVNEPGDISFVISRLLTESTFATGQLAGLIDPARIAVAGQSDGAEAALAVADSKRMRDRRVRAALVLSGAEMSGIGGYSFSPSGPALLAVQGTADTSNEPRYTYAYFRAARRPKYLLRLLGAEHLPPYSNQQPQLGIVERVSISFLRGYLGVAPAAIANLTTLGGVPGAAELLAEP